MMNDLFGLVSRDERQAQCLHRWKESKGHATIVASTGFGKTRVGTNLIGKLLNKYPNFKVIVVVPTTTLKEQWEVILDDLGYLFNCEVLVVNTAIKSNLVCDLLIIDEIHRVGADTFSTVFQKITYKLILGLTATIERLDGKEEIIKKYCPVCDEITLEVCLLNGWISPYKEYQVLIEVSDIEDYKAINKEFVSHFEFFNFNFDLAMQMIGKDGIKHRLAYRDLIYSGNNQEEKKAILREITIHATGLMRTMQAKKAFINNHPKKIDLARKIITARPMAKIITFSNSIKTAEAIGIGKVYSGKDSKKKGRATIEELKRGDFQVLNTSMRANEGLDVPDLSVAIMLGIDSSSIKAIQRVGRVCRKYGDKQAEIFNLIINQTQECEWFKKSHAKSSYITIDEQGLEDVLNGKEPKPYVKPINKWTFRY